MFPISNSNLHEQSQDPNYDVNLPSLFKLLAKDINEEDEMKPSTYQREVNLSVEERLKELRSISKYNDYFKASYCGDFFDCFDVDPSILIFQNWKVNEEYSATIIIRSKIKKFKFISLSVEESEIIQITPKQVRKISGHGSVIYKVTFLPVHYINYKIKITINSDNSFYNFEIIGLSPRPIINFPDEIDFDKIMINFKSIKTVYLTNIGRGDGIAKIYSHCQDIHVEPEYICMSSNDVLNLEIKFHPSVLGHIKEKIIILYSTGEKLCIEIIAFVISGNIFLNEDELAFKDTFITFTELNSLVVNNKTDYPVHYRWHINKNEQADKIRISSRICETDIYCDKILQDLNSASNDMSSNSIGQGVFSIMPMEGMLQPDGSFTFLVMFSPITVGKAESIFYLEIEGLENKLPVSITGIGLGPTIHLNISTLDMDNIYVNEKYDYQIFAKNSSLVSGTIRLLPISVFNNLTAVEVDFKEALLKPKDILLINVSVTNRVLGSFVVELQFEIVESRNIIKCLLKGTTIEPVIKVDTLCIDFGTVPIGVNFDKYFTIANHSPVDVKLKLEIQLDSIEDATLIEKFAASSFSRGLPERPNEFHLVPDEFVIAGISRAEIKVSLVANIARKFNSNIIISSEMHLYEEKNLPICFIAIAPEINCFPNSLALPYCFKGVEYERTILLSNNENVQVSFWLLDYLDETNGIYCRGKCKEMSLIEPTDSLEFALQLGISSVGEHSFAVSAFILGKGISPLCEVKITGTGPVILVETECLVWPHADILNPYAKTFSMMNYSPIPAEFSISLKKDPKLWTISPTEGSVEPDETVYIEVIPKPTDVGPVKDCLQIEVKETRTIKIKLEAIATGTSIRFSPDIFPMVDFGSALRFADNNRKILVSNIGSKAQVVVFSAYDTPNIKKIRAQKNSIGKHFLIEPSILVLPEYSEMFIQICSKSQSLGIKEETIHCFTRYENKYQMTCLGSTILRANFIDLDFTYDPSLLHFNIVSDIHQDPEPTTRSFVMFTNWNSPVKLIMSVPEPFGIFKDEQVIHEDEFMISIDKPLETDIYFDPMFVKDYKIQSYSITLTFFIVDYNCEKSCTISADVYFPSVSISSSLIDFECVELLHSSCKEITVRNTTPTPISYKWYWVSVIPLNLDRDTTWKSSMEISTTPSSENDDLWEQTRSSLRILDSIENHRFSSFKEFESKARSSGLDVYPLVNETDSHNLSHSKRTLVDLECASFFEFSPFWSELEANKCLVTFINFTPRYHLFFEAIAVCVVEGGPWETLVMKGFCAPVNFEIIPQTINFGFAPCCEICKSIFIIKNDSLKTLPFEVHAPKLTHMYKNALNESRIWVDEDSGVVKPFSSIQIEVTVWFGTLGEVVINTLLVVNDIPSNLMVIAYGCPNQVLISLPRKFPQLTEEYLILASFKEPWFYISEILTEIVDDDWENILIPEMFPSNEDICLGMERYSLQKTLILHPSLFSEHYLAKRRTFTIKGFEVPGYLIDFGILVLGTKAEYIVEIFNYYPREIVLRTICKNLLDVKGVEFQDMRPVQVLPPLGSMEFSILIFLKNLLKKSEVNINYSFHIEVMCGPRIPILLTATISVPHLLLPDSIDFGIVKCNQMKIINIPIKNIGIIPCEWIAFVHDKKGYHHELDNPKSYVKIPFIVKKSHGYTEPNISDYIPICFKPKKSGEYNMILEFIINMNAEKITIPIKGTGLKPLISLSNINFGSAVPFCKPMMKAFEVVNLSPFPVEVFFRDFDEEFMAEKLVFEAVKRYYKENVYVEMAENEIIPYNKIGNIYGRIFDEAIMLEKISRRHNVNDFYQTPSYGVRSRSAIMFNERYKLDLRRCKSLPSLEKLGTNQLSLMSLCHNKSPKLLVEEYLNYLDSGFNPIPPYLTMKGGNFHCSKPEPFLSKRITLMIVLGAPETNHIEWGAKLAKALEIASVSLDEIIFQELSESSSRTALEICECIREIYNKGILKDDYFDDSSEYSCSNYLELKFMVEEIISNCPSTFYKFSTAHVMIDGIKHSQDLLFGLTAKSLKQLIRNWISRYSADVLIEKVQGVFFTDVIIALSILIELFTDNTNFHLINLHSFPICFLKLNQRVTELETENISKAIVKCLRNVHGIRHAQIIEAIPSFIKRYYNSLATQENEDILPSLLHFSTIYHNQKKESSSDAESIFTLDSLENSSHFVQMIQQLCCDIIQNADPEIIKTRSFLSHSELNYFLNNFMKYARWFSSLAPLWSLARHSRSSGLSKTFLFDVGRRSITCKSLSKHTRSPSQLGPAIGRTHLVANRQISYTIRNKSSSKHARSLSKLRSSIVNDYYELPLWTLYTKDLDYEKFIPLICSKKADFGIKFTPKTKEEAKDLVIPEPKVYFHLPSMKTADSNPKLTNLNIYNEMGEDELLKLYGSEELIKESTSKILCYRTREYYKSNKRKAISRYDVSLSSIENIGGELQDLEFTTRKLLGPGEKATWKVVYSPIFCGKISDTLAVCAAGFSDNFMADINCVCDLPTTAFMFSDLLHKISFDSIFTPYQSGFCAKESTYYFPPTLISRLRKQKNPVNPLKATFKVTNTSSVPAQVFINFFENSKEFDVLPKEVNIKANEAVTITIFSTISCVGTNMKEIFLSTVNNPLPRTIKVHSEGILPAIKFKPKKLKFKNVLLYQEKNSVFQITNLCYKPVYWEITSEHPLAPVIKCSKMSNILDPDTNEEIAVSFRPEECYVFKKLCIKVSDPETKTLLQYKVYKLHLDATDIKVNINTNLNTKNYLGLGDIKVLNKYIGQVTLSKSKSNNTKVFYRIRFATNESKRGYNISDYITTNSRLEGYILKKNINLKVEVFCKDEVHFERVKAIFVDIYSPFDSDLRIAEIPLIFSFHSHFPKYAVYPGDCLDFGHVEIDTEKKLFLTLKNIGVIDFDYSIRDSIFNICSTPCSQDSLIVQDSLLNVILIPPLKICKNTGNILPGKEEVYEVVCKPKTVEKMFYEILLTIPELPESTRTISIYCTGIAPVLNFDIESLFREYHILNTREELADFNDNGCFVAVFIKTESTLYFRNVALCQTVNVDMFIENKSMLSCNASMIVDGEGFSVQPSTLYMKPYFNEIVTFTYSPQLLGVHKGTVKIKLDVPYTIENSSFTFLVEGSSELPVINICDYFTGKIVKNNQMKIGYTTNKTPVRHLFRIHNCGNVFSQTIIDVEDAINMTVTLGLVSIQNVMRPDFECGTKAVRLYLQPKETAIMGCTIAPQSIGRYALTLVAYTVLNPYEKQKILISGAAITVNILLDGLAFNKYFHKQNSKSFIARYFMNYGLCENGMIKKIIFYISNESSYLWAFKFSRFEFVSFSPDTGFVRPHCRIKVESVLWTDEQIPPKEKGTLFLSKVKIIDELNLSEPKIIWKVPGLQKFHRTVSDETLYSDRSNVTNVTMLSNVTARTVLSDAPVQEAKRNKIIVDKIDSKITLLAKCWPTEGSLHLHRDDQSKFRSTVVNQCSEEILFLENSSEASCHVIFQLENLNFEEMDCESQFLDKIGFVKIPSHAVLSEDPADELHFFDMNQVFPDVCLKDIFRPLFAQEMLLPDSTIKAKFTFCPPKPGIFSANVRIIMDDTLLDYPQTHLYSIGFVPPIQIAFKNEFKLSGVPSSIKCIKITAYEPKCFIRNKLIYVYNATNETFSYNWSNKHNVSSVENSLTGFYCHQVSGNLESQSVLKLEMIFNPQDYGVYKSHWHLEIPEYNVEQAFLFIGETKIPDIIFEPDILTMDPVFLDMKIEKQIKIHNKEPIPLKYEVDIVSLYSDIESEKLAIYPVSGLLEPNKTHEVTISTVLHVQRKYVYKTFWSFDNVARRHCFKVITQCLSVEVDVCCLIERNNTNETILLKENENNFINIGKVSINDVLNFVFVISNKGKVAINYEWIYSENETNKLDIEINPYDEIVPAFTEFSTLMKITVLQKFHFENIRFILKVFKGPVYTLFFYGSSQDPLYRLSFREHDFGACLIQTNDNVYNTVNLHFENLDEEMLQFKLKSPDVDYFKIQSTCSSLPPNSGINIPIHFLPRQKRRYNETIEFYINEKFTDCIVLLGEGEVLQVDAVDPLKGIVAFDPIGANELISKEIRIINSSKVILNVNLKIKNQYEELIEIKLDPNSVELEPNLRFKISVYVRCSRFGDYSGIEICAACREYEMRLFSLTVHCVGAKLAFDRETINFFPHFRKHLHREELAIINSGNIPTRFKIDTTGLPKYFKIEPTQGECLPGIPYILNILCCVKFITSYLSTKVKCIDVGKTGHLELNLVTYPFPPSLELQTLKFLCPVRQENAKSISVKNGTKKALSLIPLITGNYFNGEASLEVPPKSTKKYTVLYKPLTMTKDDQTHKGILVIPTQPKEMVVKLEGRSTEPLLEGNLSSIAIAREACEIKLTVENPLETLQKMSVRFRKSPSNENIFNIEGNKCIVLPSCEDREYIIDFYAYKEGTVYFDVIFTNDETFEYMFYNVKVLINPPKVSWKIIKIKTMVDHSVTKTIMIYNPLEIKDTLTITSLAPSIEYLKVEPAALDVHSKEHGKFSIIYSPKQLEERELEMKVSGDLLGTYFYRIALSSGLPLSSSIISACVPLGSKININLKLPRPIIKEVPLPLKDEYFKRKTILQHKVVSLCHSVRITVMIRTEFVRRYRKLVKKVLIFQAKSDTPEVTIKPLEDSSLIEEIICVYEPTSVGSSRALVAVEYFKPEQLFAYRIVCQCEPPQPQGPFEVSVFEPFLLEFKNVFNWSQSYSCLCVYDCSLKVSKPVFTLEAKEVIKIEISAKDDDKFEYSTMIRISDLPKHQYQWDYYFNVHR